MPLNEKHVEGGQEDRVRAAGVKVLPCVSGTCTDGTGDTLHRCLGGTSRGAALTAPSNKWDPVSRPDVAATLLPVSPIRRMSQVVNLSSCVRSPVLQGQTQQQQVARRELGGA